MSDTKLTLLRKKVEKIDQRIINLLAERFLLTRKIQAVKKLLRMPIVQKNREKALLASYVKHGTTKKLPKSLLIKLFRMIFSYAKKTDIMK